MLAKNGMCGRLCSQLSKSGFEISWVPVGPVAIRPTAKQYCLQGLLVHTAHIPLKTAVVTHSSSGHTLLSLVAMQQVCQEQQQQAVCRGTWQIMTAFLARTTPLATCILFYTPVQAAALTRLFRPMVEWYATRYQANLAVSLKAYGLRYDDLYDPAMDLVRTAHTHRTEGKQNSRTAGRPSVVCNSVTRSSVHARIVV